MDKTHKRALWKRILAYTLSWCIVIICAFLWIPLGIPEWDNGK